MAQGLKSCGFRGGSTEFGCRLRMAQSHGAHDGRFGHAAVNPSAAFLASRVTGDILDFVDRRGGAGKTGRTTPCPQSDGRSLSPSRCFVAGRDETSTVDAVDWRFFCFCNSVFDDAAMQQLSFLTRCKYALDSLGSDLHSFKVGITRYPKRRWQHKKFGYEHDGYHGMIMVGFAALGAGFLESEALAFFAGDARYKYKLKNIAMRGGEGHSVEKPGFVYIAFKTVSGVQRGWHPSCVPPGAAGRAAAKRLRSVAAGAARAGGSNPAASKAKTGPTRLTAAPALASGPAPAAWTTGPTRPAAPTAASALASGLAPAASTMGPAGPTAASAFASGPAPAASTTGPAAASALARGTAPAAGTSSASAAAWATRTSFWRPFLESLEDSPSAPASTTASVWSEFLGSLDDSD